MTDDREGAIIRNLEQFLSELESDFCYITRQYPMRIDDTDYFLDLLFFHYVELLPRYGPDKMKVSE